MIRELANAVEALLTAPVALRAYQGGEVPNIPTTPYVAIYVMRRSAGGQDYNRVSDQTALVGWRIETMHVGKSAEESQWMHDKVTERLENVRMTIDGKETTPIHYEGGSLVAPDAAIENLYYGTSTWTCVSTALQPA